MDKERIIRRQAAASLRDNRVMTVSGLLLVFASWVAAYTVFAIVCVALGALGTNGKPVPDDFQNFVITVAVVVLLLMLLFAVSPFINGFFKLCYSVSTKKEAEFSDMFYFFSSTKLYLRTIHFNAIILIKTILFYLLSLLPFIGFVILRFRTNLPETVPEDIFDALIMTSLAAGIIAGILLTVKYLFDCFVYSSGEFDSLEDVFDAARVIRKKHTSDLRGLLYTFTGWILLCFFVLPVLYVAPYFCTSAATSTKWLISLYKEGKMV